MIARIQPAGFCLALLLAVVSTAFAQENLPSNTWVAVEMDWKQPLAKVADDAQWRTGDGYSDNVLRTKTGELLIRTGIASKRLGYSPGFYTNSTVAWDVSRDRVRVVETANWGGGSYTGARLLPAFAKHATPTPRHTYDGICYVANEDAVYLMLGANVRMVGRGADEDANRQHSLDKNASTWKYTFQTGRWSRIDHNVRKFWPSVYRVSSYESHLTHWPSGKKLLFLNDHGSHYAEFDLKSQTWHTAELANKCPMRLYNARSTWDSRRGLWVFRLGPSLCTFDPKQRTFTQLPDCWDLPKLASKEEKKKDRRWSSKGICYISKHDVYLVSGPSGNETGVYSSPLKNANSSDPKSRRQPGEVLRGLKGSVV
jgi:hypothetical protein